MNGSGEAGTSRRRMNLTGARGYPGGEVQRGNALASPEVVSSETSGRSACPGRGYRVACPLTNPRGLQSERCRLRESSTLVPQRNVRCLPRFLMEVLSGEARGVAPLTPGCRSTLGLSYGSRAGKNVVRDNGVSPPSSTDHHPARHPRARNASVTPGNGGVPSMRRRSRTSLMTP